MSRQIEGRWVVAWSGLVGVGSDVSGLHFGVIQKKKLTVDFTNFLESSILNSPKTLEFL